MQPLSEALLERLKNRQAILVAGLGCSELAVLPGWRTIVLALADRVDDDAEKQAVADLAGTGQLAAAMAILRASLPPQTMAETLQGLLPARGQAPEAIQAVANAPWRGIVTTALDSTWTAALASAPDLAGRMVFAAEAASLENGRGRFLLQLFGRPDVPASLCLAPSDLGPVVVASGAAKLLEALHKKHSFVFAGFAAGDPDLALLCGRVLASSPSTNQHFFVAPGLSPIDARRVKAEYGLSPVPVDGTLEDALKALASACELASDKPAADDVEAWLERLGAEPHDEEAHTTLDQGLAKLREHKEWERLVAALISRAEIEPDAKKQAADLSEAATLLDQELAAADRAYHVVLMAIHLTPEDLSLQSAAKQIAEKAGQSKEFIEELRAIERGTDHSGPPSAMSLGIARMLAEDPARVEEAIAAYQRLCDRDPASAEALSELEALLRKADRWEPLGKLYEKLLERAPGDAAVEDKLEEVYQRTQKVPQRIELLQARLARNPDDGDTRARLVKVYEENQRWQPLAALYERHLEKNPDDPEARRKLEELYQKTQQWQQLGVLLERDLAKNPDSAVALAKIEDLFRKSEQWKPLADLLERRAVALPAADARPLRIERASILIDKLGDFDAGLTVARALAAGDPSAAEALYGKCLDRDPGNAGALLALSDLARDKGDHLRAAKFILDAAARTQNPLELGRLHAEAGIIYLDNASDEGKATECFERALAADPEQTAAAGRLLRLREKAENWLGAEPLIDLLVRKAPDDGSGGKCDLYVRQAAIARKLGKNDKAAGAFASACKLNRSSAALALDHAALEFERQAWAEARAEYQRARDLLGDKAPERTDLCEKLGACSAAMKDLDAAVNYYEEALARDPDKQSTLETLIDLQTARGAWAEQVALKRKLLLLVSDDERARLLDEIGDVQQGKLNDWPSAMASYRDALVAQPGRRQTLYKILDFHTQEKDWLEAIETLQTLAGLETDPAGRAKLNYAIAAIQRDEMRDSDKAVEMFSKVLDDSPLYPKAFEAIEKMLGDVKDWADLELAYRRQIKRLPADAPAEMKLRLWDGLADAALKLHDKESAAVTLELAMAVDRDNLPRRERLANLYFSMGPTAAEKAVAHHQALLAMQPERIDSYKALAALFFQAGAHDKVWCVAGSMTCLGKADPPLRALYENFRPTQTAGAPGKLGPDLWPKVVHPDENPHLGELFALLAPAIAQTTAESHKALGLDKTSRLDMAANDWAHAAALRYVATTIDARPPDVYVKRDAPGTIRLVNLKEKSVIVPAFVVGQGFDGLASQSQVVFALAKRMVLLRPERLLRSLLATEAALETAVRAGLQLGGEPVGAGEHRDVDKMAKQLDRHLTAQARGELKVVAKKYVEACGHTIDLAKWLIASDLTASRAALAICGDVEAATRVVGLEPQEQSLMPVGKRIHDLLAYFVSDDHFAVRAALGMQVNLTPPPGAPESNRWGSHTQIKAQG